MDVYGCRAPNTWVDRMFMWVAVLGLAASVLLGLPFLIWVALVGQFL